MNKYSDTMFIFLNCFPYKHGFFNKHTIALGLYAVSKLYAK